jgi:hypothetical protein
MQRCRRSRNEPIIFEELTFQMSLINCAAAVEGVGWRLPLEAPLWPGDGELKYPQ